MTRLLTPVLVSFLLAPAFADDKVVGNGQIDTESRKLEKFDAIEIRIVGKVEIAIGKPSPLKIKADGNILPLITTEVRDGRLVISSEKAFRSEQSPSFMITVADLKSVDVMGAADVNVRGLDNENLALSIKGSGDVKVSGETEQFSVSIAGSGDVAAFDLRARQASVSIRGSGDVKVNAVDSLDVSISGSGDVVYAGQPRVHKAIRGSGDIRRRK